MRARLPKLLRRLHRGGLRLLATTRQPESAPLDSEPEAIVNAFNALESHLEGMRDAGQRLAVVSVSLQESARHIADSVERLTPPHGRPAIAAPDARARRGHLQLLDPVA
jgi:hypothetical protein